jgi:hypothetical protein
MNFTSTLAHTEGVALTASREEGHAEAAMARSPKPHLHPPPMDWIRCTTNWWRSTPFSLCSYRSAPTGVCLTRPLTQLTPVLDGENLPWCPP